MSINTEMAISETHTTMSPKKKGGRPPKFTGPRQPVTVTLPRGTLEQLADIDRDRAQAIVKAVSHYGGWNPSESPVEFVAVSPKAGLLLVRSCQALRSVPGIRLVEVVPGRYLIVLLPGIKVESLELALGDVRRTPPEMPGGDGEVVEELLEILRRSRRLNNLETSQIVLVGIPEQV